MHFIKLSEDDIMNLGDIVTAKNFHMVVHEWAGHYVKELPNKANVFRPATKKGLNRILQKIN